MGRYDRETALHAFDGQSRVIHPCAAQAKDDKPDFQGGTLRCHCHDSPVLVQINAQSQHNHLCGCSRCWKSDGALFSQIAVVPRNAVHVVENADKLGLVDPAAVIQRYACRDCGVHLVGRIESKSHGFYGLDFIHTELSADIGWSAPSFAAYVSSVVEAGFPPEQMPHLRRQLRALGLEPYDCLSPDLMDVISHHAYVRRRSEGERVSA
ncbi:S-(hydroxymethyl)glutathione synthase [Donghicola eburneus]|uniref:S-(hydroxymethyl)glutathione synthase n=1 Tax=Donghicola eburneus TaxID=393278 RepID=UPI0008ED4621|nr:S-(hydroxymethyl)glutathione synthase [Donghicola eburneus]SFQ06659.1 S-(hydroxymethyl)glutathione synthase [Donghicola eburneus]